MTDFYEGIQQDPKRETLAKEYVESLGALSPHTDDDVARAFEVGYHFRQHSLDQSGLLAALERFREIDAEQGTPQPSEQEVTTTAVILEIGDERLTHFDRGYTIQHDDEEGLGHLIQESHYILGHLGEVSSPGAVRHELKQAASILVAAIEHIDRHFPDAKEPISPEYDCPIASMPDDPIKHRDDGSGKCGYCKRVMTNGA